MRGKRRSYDWLAILLDELWTQVVQKGGGGRGREGTEGRGTYDWLAISL